MKFDRPSHFRPALAAMLVLGASASAAAQQAKTSPVIAKTYAQSVEGPAPQLKIAKGKPNVVWILFDDAGFAASSAFGGLVETPALSALADGGLRYTNFHTTGVCAPTRAALMTGRNHHKVGMGLFPHAFMRAQFPGYTGRLEPRDGTIAEYLRDAGYSTYALGKWHLTPDEEGTDLGPFDRWPLGKGFDHFFGFLGGATDQYKPDLVEDNLHVKPDGRHLNAQLVDKAISYVDRQEALNPDKPFFLYFATGATHSPHQVDKQWIEKNKGQFDAGWDAFRETILERQKKLGVVPADAKLPPRDPRVPAWNSLSADQRKIYTRFMESYAGYLQYTDFEVGRLIDHLKEKKLFDNTVVFVVMGDNGASKEGGPNGSVQTEFQPIKLDDKGQLAEYLKRFEEIGTKDAYTNYPMGWAQTADTPFREWKADANAEGGTHLPLIVSWPASLPKGEVRGQYGHVIDLLPTTLEIAGAGAPASRNGVAQDPVQGTSLGYSFKDGKAANRHTVQYYFLFGSGAIVKDGWKASFGYRPDFVDIFATYPAPQNPANNAGKEVWELYDLNTDFNERNNLAGKYPAKLKELQAEFEKQAKENNAYPLINWTDVSVKFRAYMQAQIKAQ
jgi:arylsulfatase A-like enzyme